MVLVFKHAWVMFIVVTVVNYLILKSRSQKHIDKNPDLKVGYDKALRTFLIYGTIPWVIIAVGNLTGLTSSFFDYFRPRTLKPLVLTFHCYIIWIWILTVRWIYFKNGAEFLVQHPGLVEMRRFGNSNALTSTSIKIFFTLALLGGIAGMTMMWLVDIPIFPVK